MLASRRRLFASALALGLCLAAGATARAQEKEDAVNVYSFRQPFLVEPLFEAFEAQTGIAVNVRYAKAGLIDRARLEGRASPVDLFLTTDIGQMAYAEEQGVLRAVNDRAINAAVPARWRDPQGRWVALTLRARVAIVRADAADFDPPLTYESLARDGFEGGICIRPGRHPYNLTLFAAALAKHGEARTRAWLSGVRANLARKPAGNDRAQIRAVAGGECAVAIANAYYLGVMLNDRENPEQREIARAVKPLFIRFEDGGVHVNASAVGMARYAPRPQAALEAMRWLTGPEAQGLYAAVNHEWPVNPAVEPSTTLKSWGTLEADDAPLASIVAARGLAGALVDETGFDR